MADFSDVAARRKRRTIRVPVVLDGELAAQVIDLQKRLAVAEKLDEQLNRPPEAPNVREQIADLEEQAGDSVQDFVFTELPRRRYRDLLDKHPPTGDDAKTRRWDEDTFAPALMAAAAVDPPLTPEQASQIWEEWGTAQCDALFAGAWAAQEGEQRVPFGRAASVTTDV